MQPVIVPDPNLIRQLLDVADLFLVRPDGNVPGPAIQGLKLLFILTANWLATLESVEQSGQTIPADQLPFGLPHTIADAQTLHRNAAKTILQILHTRNYQREAERQTVGSPIFTGPDLAALKLSIRCSAVLTPVPACMQQLKQSRQPKPTTPKPTTPTPSTPKLTTPKPTAPTRSTPNPTTYELDAEDLAAQQLAADIQRMLEPASQPTSNKAKTNGDKPKTKEITKTLRSGRRIQKQLRHRPQPASVA